MHHLDDGVRRARTCFVTGRSGQQLRPTHRSSDNVCCGFRLSAIAVPVPAIMASATSQPANIFMAQSSWAATLGSSLAKSCDRHHKAVVFSGVGAVVAALPAFQSISAWLLALGGPVITLVAAIFVTASVTSKSSLPACNARPVHTEVPFADSPVTEFTWEM
jgi:hypothetical protein